MNFYRNLSSVSHLAGTAQDKEQGESLRDKFLDFGLDEAFVVPYEVLLSYPDLSKRYPNRVSLYKRIGNTSEIIYNISGIEPPLYAPEEYSSSVPLPFSAYSLNGAIHTVSAQLHTKFDERETLKLNLPTFPIRAVLCTFIMEGNPTTIT